MSYITFIANHSAFCHVQSISLYYHKGKCHDFSKIKQGLAAELMQYGTSHPQPSRKEYSMSMKSDISQHDTAYLKEKKYNYQSVKMYIAPYRLAPSA